jgi:hypothetical protein
LTVAISALEYGVIFFLKGSGLLPKRPRVLELGESNWYGDISTEQLAGDIRKHGADVGQRDELLKTLDESVKANRPDKLYEIARVFWRAGFDFESYSAIDTTTPGAKYRFNLNVPISLAEQFDITLNIGTAEHIFNVYQFFKTMHERTAAGGWMFHTAPFMGWPNHGFFTFQPTFFYDLANSNRYQIVMVVCAQLQPWLSFQVKSQDELGTLIREGKLPGNCLIHVVMRKASEERPFIIPIQGIYSDSGTLSEEMKKVWGTVR